MDRPRACGIVTSTHYTPCVYPGCAELVEPDTGGRCKEHRRKSAQNRAQKNMPPTTPKQRGYPSNWQDVARMYLDSNPWCKAERCREPATQCDHIIPLADGGLNDSSNYQGLCASCHGRKTARECNSTTTLMILYGPPGAGKTTYAKQHMKRGELLIDFESIQSAITGLAVHDHDDKSVGFVIAARSAMLDALDTGHQNIHRVWLPTTSSNDVDRWRGRGQRSRVIVFEASASRCMSQIKRDSSRHYSPGYWEPLIDTWWAEYDRRPGYEVLQR